MMFGDVNDAAKRAEKFINEQLDPGSSEARALIQELYLFVNELRNGGEIRISFHRGKLKVDGPPS